MNTYVLYNSCYGGFSFNRDFIIALFKRFPPCSPEGNTLFAEIDLDCDDLVRSYELKPFFGDYYFLHDIAEADIAKADTYEGYEPSYIENRKTNKVYYIHTQMEKERSNPNIIKFLFERADSMTEEEFNIEYDNILTEWLSDLEREQLLTKNKVKKFSIHNWKDSSILVSHMLVRNISGSYADLQIQQIKPGMSWSISEYDGVESVIIKFDYYKIITELVNELQINQIEPSSTCSELLQSVIRGEITISQLKELEKTYS